MELDTYAAPTDFYPMRKPPAVLSNMGLHRRNVGPPVTAAGELEPSLVAEAREAETSLPHITIEHIAE